MSSVDLLVAVVMAIPIVAVVLAAIAICRWKGMWRLGALIPPAFIALWVIGVLLDWPYEHTLWPFELLVYGLVSFVYMLVLRYAHIRMHRAKKLGAA